MFDGAPGELTAARVREIYGVSEDEFEEEAAAEAPVHRAPALA